MTPSTGNLLDVLAALPISILAFLVARIIMYGLSDDIVHYLRADLVDDAATFVALLHWSAGVLQAVCNRRESHQVETAILSPVTAALVDLQEHHGDDDAKCTAVSAPRVLR
eukprot:CAMPEP_0181443938 /NCGR_PEP_ID=MMETSP1110-20121109/24808_1 /TAXON_ID=174948 /ORGANISM="Symbiodinium sp., Strain CCMP421" /LENGTH=110 /DNA_ID=CAMNT_0023567923 /DNA_START=118 /DNA_END=446 /DNA_ORIENTATION=+